jgi:hypothetical protein
MRGVQLISAQRGATFAEVLISMTLLLIGLMGAMGSYQAADRGLRASQLATRALAMAESRIEAKRAARWDRLLVDDLDDDGLPDLVMRDDGQEGDAQAGDTIYTGSWDHDGVHLLWTVAPSRPGSLATAGYVALEARATYITSGGPREVRIGTLRANPVFVGSH